MTNVDKVHWGFATHVLGDAFVAGCGEILCPALYTPPLRWLGLWDYSTEEVTCEECLALPEYNLYLLEETDL